MDRIPELLDAPQLLALAGALGWASGFRLYAAVFLTGLAGAMGWFELPPGLQVLQHPGVLAASGFMLFVEFFADKIPYVDSIWDAVHTVVRIPAGAALAAGALGANDAAMGWIAALVGGSLAATSHATKLTTRAAVNTSPEPFSNWTVSLFEDGLVVFLLWLAATHPALFTVVLVVSVLVAAVLLVVLVKFLRVVLRGLLDFFEGRRLPREL
ncbi:MAG TPA: DUF4126 domain-containing protein [Ramlibacter sp.]|jgi:hypothetical protein|uniref:DUF4126 domain-containing protein n=1 Tax=Ramlibacter sp. TaxID=1917967 RepID=UPI002D2EEAE8|nr:DUF4126 domain-containing protein [Ramlibacter sp.]HZY18782.1 DUF4126 domain-containing protein [Ramlibacter sp.]